MSYDEAFLEQLKSRNDIVDVVSAYCSLQRRGSSYWACCPLPGHLEKTPSFCVNQNGQFYKCFGCGRGGDVIKFIMEIEGLDFVDAVKFLAERAGMQVQSYDAAESAKLAESRKQRERLLALMKDAALFYVHNLYSDGGRAYRKYLEGRGFGVDIWKKFGIGASLDFFSLHEHLASRGYTDEEMLQAGVVSYGEKSGKYIDFETKRLVVPIIDAMGNVIAFGGRVLEKTDFGKYKNTPETKIFIKNKCLFNANNLKKLRRNGNLSSIIMVEGYMDVIALAAAGIENVAASMGTSLTPQQAKLLRNYAETVIVSYDGDSAGQKATMRGLKIFSDAGLNVKVVSLPDGLDPDEFIKARGVEEYNKLVQNALPLIDFKLEYLRNRFDLNAVDERRKYVSNALRVIRESNSEAEREELLKKVSAVTRITFEALKRDLENTQLGAEKAEAPAPIAAAQDKAANKAVKAERFVVCCMAENKDFVDIDELSTLSFSLDEHRQKLFEYALDKLESGERVFSGVLDSVVGEEGLGELQFVLSACDDVEKGAERRYYRDCINTLKEYDLLADIDELTRLHDSETDLDEQGRYSIMLAKKLQELNKLRKIKSEDIQ